MSENRPWAAKGCAILAAVAVGVPLLVVGVVGVRTLVPLQGAGEALDQLNLNLGAAADYRPAPTGAIPAERMDAFLELRTLLVGACGDYGEVRKGFDSVASLESKDPKDPKDPKDIGGVGVDLGGAALSITPFLARFFELRNEALLEASMGLQEYSYIFAVAYHEVLLSGRTRREIFSDGVSLSPAASLLLRECLGRQLQSRRPDDGVVPAHELLLEEMAKMETDPSRLIWQGGLPEPVSTSLGPYRDRLNRLFCSATAGLEMEQDARRALRVALE